MGMDKISILVKDGAGGEKSTEIDAYKVGALAVHKCQTHAYESDDWVITSVKQGRKFPGQTTSLKVAIACAEDLNTMFAWDTYDPDKNKDVALKAREVLVDWGVHDF